MFDPIFKFIYPLHEFLWRFFILILGGWQRNQSLVSLLFSKYLFHFWLIYHLKVLFVIINLIFLIYLHLGFSFFFQTHFLIGDGLLIIIHFISYLDIWEFFYIVKCLCISRNIWRRMGYLLQFQILNIRFEILIEFNRLDHLLVFVRVLIKLRITVWFVVRMTLCITECHLDSFV